MALGQPAAPTRFAPGRGPLGAAAGRTRGTRPPAELVLRRRNTPGIRPPATVPHRPAARKATRGGTNRLRGLSHAAVDRSRGGHGRLRVGRRPRPGPDPLVPVELHRPADRRHRGGRRADGQLPVLRGGRPGLPRGRAHLSGRGRHRPTPARPATPRAGPDRARSAHGRRPPGRPDPRPAGYGPRPVKHESGRVQLGLPAGRGNPPVGQREGLRLRPGGQAGGELPARDPGRGRHVPSPRARLRFPGQDRWLFGGRDGHRVRPAQPGAVRERPEIVHRRADRRHPERPVRPDPVHRVHRQCDGRRGSRRGPRRR